MGPMYRGPGEAKHGGGVFRRAARMRFDPTQSAGAPMKRRRFLFWISFGLFTLSEKLRFSGLDRLAAATMRLADPADSSATSAAPEHWTFASNKSWRWYERETFVDGNWKLTGITTPIDLQTGEPYTGRTGYIDESLVPLELRLANQTASAIETADVGDDTLSRTDHQPDASRRARHGRPPSKWLRSLRADEIRIWLKAIEVPEAGVSGMTFWTHLTRDHFFDANKIAGLTIDEQAKLHAAAHYGY